MTRAPYVPTARQLRLQEEDARFGVRGTGKPTPGLYAVKLRKGGVEVAARIAFEPTRDPDSDELLDRSPHWSATINGETDPDPSPEPSDRVWRVYEFGRRIDEAEYRFLLADRMWAREHAPNLPEASPRQKIDHLTVEPPF